jgi:MFS transporter, DHA3 family, macrolide efflux protein
MRLLRPLRDVPIALLWGGLATSAVGDQLYAVALSWIAVAVFGAAAGYLTALQATIVLLTALGSGHWADRRASRSVMIAADMSRAAVLLLVVVVWLTAGHPPAWGLVLAVLVLAVGQALFRPALQVMLPALITDRSLLPAANGLLDSTDRIARLVGPGVVALLAGFLPLAHFLTLDAATFAASAVAITLIGRLRTLPHATPGVGESVGAAVTRGFRAMRRHALLGYVLGSTCVINGAWYPVMFLGLPLAIEHLGVSGPGSPGNGAGLSAYGLVISAYGWTNLLATLVVGNLTLPMRPGLRMFSGSMIVGTGILLLAAVIALPMPPAARLPCLMAASGLAGIGGPMSDITIATLRQTLLASADMAAAMRAYMVMNNLGLLVGMLLAPGLFRGIGVAGTVCLCGAAILFTGMTGILRHGAARVAPA